MGSKSKYSEWQFIEKQTNSQILVCQIEKLELWKESLLMGQIANQMALELFFKIKERIKEKKKQKQANKNNGSKK